MRRRVAGCHHVQAARRPQSSRRTASRVDLPEPKNLGPPSYCPGATSRACSPSIQRAKETKTEERESRPTRAWRGRYGSRRRRIPRGPRSRKLRRLGVGPLAFGIATMELLFRFIVFRKRGDGTRLFAAFMGLALLLRGVVIGLLDRESAPSPARPGEDARLQLRVSLAPRVCDLRTGTQLTRLAVRSAAAFACQARPEYADMLTACPTRFFSSSLTRPRRTSSARRSAAAATTSVRRRAGRTSPGAARSGRQKGGASRRPARTRGKWRRPNCCASCSRRARSGNPTAPTTRGSRMPTVSAARRRF